MTGKFLKVYDNNWFDIINPAVKCPTYYEIYQTEHFLERETTRDYYVEDKDGKIERKECEDSDEEKCANYLGQIRINRKAELIKFASDRIEKDKVVAVLEKKGDKTIVQSYTLGSRSWPTVEETETEDAFTKQRLFEIKKYTSDIIYDFEILEDYALVYVQDS